jgi:hypothetical protein
VKQIEDHEQRILAFIVEVATRGLYGKSKIIRVLRQQKKQIKTFKSVMFKRLSTSCSLPGSPSFQSNNLSGHNDKLCFIRFTEVAIVDGTKVSKIPLPRSQLHQVINMRI